MLKLMKDEIDALGIPATPVQFDSTIARTEAHLRNSIVMNTQVMDRTDDTLFMDVSLTNIIGHKFPSGFPNRRAFVQVIALTATGDTLFQSGRWDSTYEVIGHDSIYEPHHDAITREDQVRIYEFVMGDVNGDVTTTLLRAVYRLKDNRIPPIGFSTSHASYDTTRIAGLALIDPNFNHDALGTEGNGGDAIHHHIATNGYLGAVELKTKVYFQQVPPRWNREMFSHHGPRIDAFRAMYTSADGTPDLVVADSLLDIGTGMRVLHSSALQAFPNPTRDGFITITSPEATKVLAYDAAGKRVPLKTTRSGNSWRCELPEQTGVYHLVISTPQGDRMVRVVRMSP